MGVYSRRGLIVPQVAKRSIQYLAFRYCHATAAVVFIVDPNRWSHIFFHTDQYIYHTDGKNHYRRIFYGVEFTQFEKEHMQQLLAQIQKEGIQLPPE